jgi:hypothetical protein
VDVTCTVRPTKAADKPAVLADCVEVIKIEPKS